VPYYLQGVSPGVFSPSDPHTTALVASGIDPDTADIIFGAVSNGLISQSQFEQILSGQMSDDDIGHLLYGVSGKNQIPVDGESVFNLLSTLLGDDGSYVDYTDLETGGIDWSNVGADAATPATIFNATTGQMEANPLNSAYSSLLDSTGTDLDPLDYSSPQAALDAGVPPSTVAAAWTPAAQVQAAVLSAGGTTAQAKAAAAKVTTSSSAGAIATAIASALKTIVTATSGASPRIITTLPTTASPLTQSSILPGSGIPDVAVIGVGLLAAVMMLGKR
jgi:hypothetical protein